MNRENRDIYRVHAFVFFGREQLSVFLSSWESSGWEIPWLGNSQLGIVVGKCPVGLSPVGIAPDTAKKHTEHVH